MRNRLYVLSAAAALAVAAGCNRVASDDFGAERVEERYTTAVADYSAGRLKEAMEGFTAVVQANPANSSARFHLAVLMQDFKRDFLGAICNYREYLMLAPASDKARVARERMESCQKDLAAEFAAKYNLSDNTALKKELNMVRDRLAAKEKDADDAAKKLAEAEGSICRAFSAALSGLRKEIPAGCWTHFGNTVSRRPVLPAPPDTAMMIWAVRPWRRSMPVCSGRKVLWYAPTLSMVPTPLPALFMARCSRATSCSPLPEDPMIPCIP